MPNRFAIVRLALLVSSALLFWLASGYRTEIEWDIIDFAIGLNVLSGNGFVAFPGAPAAIWRSPLTPVIGGVVLAFVQDPIFAFRIVFTIFLCGTTFVTFLVAERMFGFKKALFASLLLMTTPAILLYLVGIIGAKNTMTHPVLIFLTSLGTLLSLLAAQKGKPRHYVSAGIVFALAYLARTDGLLYFGAVLCWFVILKLWFHRDTTVPVKGVALYVLAFFVVVGPWLAFLKTQTGQIQANSQAIYSFYSSEGWVRDLRGDVEGDGYKIATEVYGSPEQNNYSIISSIARNPAAFKARIETNLAHYMKRFFASNFVPEFLIPVIVVGLISCLVSSRPCFLLIVLIILPNFVYLAFQTDPRYLTHSLPPIAILISVGIVWPLDLVGEALKRFRIRLTPILALQSILPSISLLVSLGIIRPLDSVGGVLKRYRIGAASILVCQSVLVLTIVGIFFQNVGRTSETQVRVTDIEAKRLGETIRSIADDKGMKTPILLIEGPLFTPLVAFYANGRFSWTRDPIASGEFPRDIAFSMNSYPKVDLAILYTFQRAIPEDVALAGEFYDSKGGRYVILDGESANREFPERIAVTIRKMHPTSSDRVRCQSGGFSPDGQGDFVFEVVVDLPRTRQIYVVERIEVLRETPSGIWESKGPNFVLGVAESPDGPLINAPDGNMAFQFAGGAAKTIWLFACNDKAGLNESSYIAKVYLKGGARFDSVAFRK